jgi:peptidoglycan hydrolase-like protein with peptidoglycan-binding domain
MRFSRKNSARAAFAGAVIAALTGVGTVAAEASTKAPNVSQSSTTKAKTTCVQRAVNIRVSITIDGVWGSKTTRAVKAYQTLFGFTPDGIVGKTTGSAMMSDIKFFDFRHGTHYYAGCYPIIPTRT